MLDREKIITALAICTGKCKCFGCWYGQNNPDFRCQDRLKADALALLLEHEPVEPENGKCPECGYTVHRINYDGPYNGIRHEWFRFCPSCGKAVKWND